MNAALPEMSVNKKFFWHFRYFSLLLLCMTPKTLRQKLLKLSFILTNVLFLYPLEHLETKDFGQAEAYSEPGQTSKKKRFTKIVIFAKCSLLNGPECADFKNTYKKNY